ncbi:MAG: FAD:protein FMN transferase [Oscillospiraceae bacterium]|nr:FAD:protein FMN transferase [Oscillospiraceae bacterium]
MKKRVSVLFTTMMVILTVGCSRNLSATGTVFAMDTAMTLTLYGKQATAAFTACETEIYRLEQLFSVTNMDSELSQINQSSEQTIAISEDTAAVIKAAIEIYTETDGAFDITIAPVVEAWGFYTKDYHRPSDAVLTELLKSVDGGRIELTDSEIKLGRKQKIDLGAIAKGYLSDCIKSILDDYDIHSAVISLGGSVLTLGMKPDKTLWNVGLEDPLKQHLIVGVLNIIDCSVVTSGSYERFYTEDGINYHHIFDPVTGYPAVSDLLSVTVIMPSATTADGYSTALFIMGKDRAIEFWRNHGEFDMILITETKEVLVSQGITECFSLVDQTGYILNRIE